MLTVVHAPTGTQAFLAKYRAPIAIGSVAFAGMILVVILLSGRFRIKSRSEQRAARQRRVDPVTQPVAIQQAELPSNKKRAKRRPRARSDRRIKDAPAYFTRLGDDGETVTGHPIPLVEMETTFGADPIQAAHVLDHPSIAVLHARLTKKDGNEYLLVDNESVAGTWVNFDQIPKKGCILKHGDVVHFGQLMYRFSLKNPPAEAGPKIIPEVPAE